MKDKKRKELEIQRILEKNRQNLLNKMDHKMSEEEIRKEQRKRDKELSAMMKEDKHATMIRQRDLEKKMKELAMLQGKEDEAMFKQLEEMKRLQALQQATDEEEERLRREREAAEVAVVEGEEEAEEEEDTGIVRRRPTRTREDGLQLSVPSSSSRDGETGYTPARKTRSKSMFSSYSATLDNYDPDAITPIHSAREGDSKEGNENDDDDDAMTATDGMTNDDESTKPGGTAIEEHLRLLIANIQSGMENHRNHPRKILKNGKYYIPLVFNEDLEFNPFSSNITKLNDFILTNIEREIFIENEEKSRLKSSKSFSFDQMETSSLSPSSRFVTGFSSPKTPKTPKTPTRSSSKSPTTFHSRSNSPLTSPNSRYHQGGVGVGVGVELDDDEMSYSSFGADNTMNELLFPNRKFAGNPFDDLTKTLKDYRKTTEKQRKLMFATDHSGVPIADWTPFYKSSHVNWKQFFKKEQAKLDIIKQMGQAILAGNDGDEEEDSEGEGGGSPEGGKKAKDLEKILMENLKSRSADHMNGEGEEEEGINPDSPRSLNSSHSNSTFFSVASTSRRNSLMGGFPMGNTRASFSNASFISQIPKTLLESLPKDVKKDIIPLPFGKIVKKQKVKKGKLKFYQMEIFNPNGLLTIEIEMIQGSCELLVHQEKLPSTVKYQYKMTCSKRKMKKRSGGGVASSSSPDEREDDRSLSPSIGGHVSNTSSPSDSSLRFSPSILSPSQRISSPSTTGINRSVSVDNNAAIASPSSPFDPSATTGDNNNSNQPSSPNRVVNAKNNQIYRLVIQPEKTGIYFIAIHSTSSPGTIYNLWSYLSGEREDDLDDTISKQRAESIVSRGGGSATSATASASSSSTVQNHHLQKVDEIVKKWNLLLNDHEEEELLLHFPKLEMEASRKINEQNEKKIKDHLKRREIVNEMKELKANHQLKPLLDSIDIYHSPDDMLDSENLEKFVTKVGRYAIRKERELILKKTKEILQQQTTSNANAATTKDAKDNNSSSQVYLPVINQGMNLGKTNKQAVGKGETISPTKEEEEEENKINELDFDNLFDENDVFLENNNLLIKEANSRAHTSTSSPSHQAVAATAVRYQIPKNLQHSELFSVPDIHRTETVSLFKPLSRPSDDSPVDFKKEFENLQEEESLIEKAKMQRQSSVLPVLSLHFNTFKVDGQHVHNSSSRPEEKKKKQRKSSISSKTGKSIVNSASDGNLSGGGRVRLPSIFAKQQQQHHHHHPSSNPRSSSDSQEFALTPSSSYDDHHYHYDLEGIGQEEAEKRIRKSTSQNYRPFSVDEPLSMTQFTSLPDSLLFDPSASSPIMATGLEKKMKINDLKNAGKQTAYNHGPHQHLLRNPKVINYTLTKMNK
jgi:hypothetical protein